MPKDTANAEGQIRVPPAPRKKSKFGSIREPTSGHPGRKGLYGQEKDSMGFVENTTHRQKPSGTGGSD